MRMRLTTVDPITAATRTDENGIIDPTAPIPEREALAERLPGERFHMVAIVEETWSGDGRYWTAGSITWRTLQEGSGLPVTADDVNHMAHLEAKLIGNIDEIERIGNEIHAWGAFIDSDDPEVIRLQGLVREGRLRGVSADMDEWESELLIPAEQLGFDEADELDAMAPDENGDVHIPMTMLREVYTASRVIGACILTLPAFEQGIVEMDRTEMAEAVAASAGVSGWVEADLPASPEVRRYAALDRQRPRTRFPDHFSPVPIVASAATDERPMIEAPVVPPRSWFDDPHLDGPTAMTVLSTGQMFGHLAAWDSCHIGFTDRCVTPPRSATNYAHFCTGELICDDGDRVAVGQVTMNTGHAPLNANAVKAAAHYDDTGWAVADLTAGEDRHGIWLAGGLRPGINALTLRGLMAADLSGDWRRIGHGLELVAALAVNVPGFHKHRRASIKARHASGMLTAFVASLPVEDRVAAVSDATARKIMERLAATIGRSTEQRIAEQVRRVKGPLDVRTAQ